MSPRRWKVLLGFILLLGLQTVFRFIHNPNVALSASSEHFQKALVEFLNRVKSVETSKELKLATAEAMSGQVMGSNSKNLNSLLSENQIDAEVYIDQEIRFWSTNVNELGGGIYAPVGLSLQKFKTGWFAVYKIQVRALSVIFTNPIRYQYNVPNQFLKNDFLGSFKIPRYFRIQKSKASFSRVILNPETHVQLGFLSLDDQGYNSSMNFFQGLLLISIVLISIFILYHLNVEILQYPHLLGSILLGIISPFLVFKIFSTYLLNIHSLGSTLFDRKIYQDLPFFHSLGEYAVFLFYLWWLLYYFKKIFPKNLSNKPLNKLLSGRLIGFLGLLFSSLIFIFLFQSLLFHVKVSLDLTNIINLNPLSCLVMSLLSLVWCIFSQTLIAFTKYLHDKTDFAGEGWEWILGILIFWGITYWIWNLSGFLLSIAITVFFLFIYYEGYKASILHLGLTLFGISIITSVEINNLTLTQEHNNRMRAVKQLANSRDPFTEKLLEEIGKGISADPSWLEFLMKDHKRSYKQLNQEIQKRYFERDFPNYDIQSYLYNNKGALLLGPTNLTLDIFQEVAQNSSTRKVSSLFYQAPGKIGLNNYFSIIPYRDPTQKMGLVTLVVQVNARFIRENNSFPVLLLDQQDINNQNGLDYSYAFYKNGSLIDKYGKYPYSILSEEFQGILSKEKTSQKRIAGYDHLVYSPHAGELMVISVPSSSIFKLGTLFSYIFGFYFLFFGLLWILFNSISSLKTIKTIHTLLRHVVTTRLLYKTRIQLAIVASVFLSLSVIGWITITYVNNQYRLQQNDQLSDQLNNLREVFEREIPTDSLNRQSEKSNRLFLDFSAGHSQDLNFYNTEGDLVFTSLGRVFEEGLLSQKMAPKAYYAMFGKGRTEYIQNEKIGRLTFLSGYTPIRNNENRVIGYLNLPYFANQIAIGQRLSNFLNSLINVYLVSFLFIGVFAIILANSLTKPLNLVQNSLSQTKIGNLNQPILWKREDEIGDLISEYNKMIAKIEESTHKLAQSERESAWREMAKQVAHEIKNPLTPLKLGIQMLERSWKEQDPRFDEKFKRFSRTFIEQIESLSTIATEFSNFAKMPIAKLERINVFAVIEQVVDLFKATENVQFTIQKDSNNNYLLVDRDQIARAFTNLIKNAIQSIPEDRPGKVLVKINREQQTLLIKIEDNGVGIERETFEKIFYPNFTTKSSGTGLGLAFVKNVIEQAGGEIQFISEINIGTTFILKVPIA